MGTSIELTVGGVSLSYSKNHMGVDFGFLFQEGDDARRILDGIDYEYYQEHPEEAADLAQHETVFARQLSRVLPRLQLLGCAIGTARAEYEAIVAEELHSSIDNHSSDEKPDFLSFEEFCALVCRYPLAKLGCDFVTDDEKAKGRLKAEKDFDRLRWTENSNNFWSEASYFGARLAILSAESMLQVLALSPDNASLDVVWEFGPLVHAGWENREAFQPGARRRQKILIVTEGASDARIIKRALEVIRPDVADFFNFIDVDERHHFWGTGNLVKFAEGLLRIDIQNRVLFVLDNDAEGVDAHQKLNRLKLPPNMRSMLLPSLEEFCNFPTRGPEGVAFSDINGRAAAIECYLDFNAPEKRTAQVVWSNYKKDIDAWHGALEFKESYQHHFYDQPLAALRGGHYDTSKLTKLLDALIEQAALVSDTV
jgi:hypothetical protein